MVQVKKISKYGKYFLLFTLASVVSFMWPSNTGQGGLLPTVPHAHADVPLPGSGSDGGGDSDGGSDCADTGGSDCDG